MAAFNLAENAFAILRITPRANRAQIEDAYQVALLDAESRADEETVHRAHRALTSPRERLDSELSYFLDATPAKIKATLASLSDPNATESAVGLTGADRANLLAHYCSCGSSAERLSTARDLIAAHMSVADEQVLQAIQGLRVASGFGEADLAAIRAGIVRLREWHAEVLVDAIMASDVGPIELAKQFADAAHQPRLFLDVVSKRYEHHIAPRMLAAVERIRGVLVRISDTPNASDAFDALEVELRAWNGLVQPLQIADRTKGIDEHNSLTLFEEVRTLCLDLANERGRYVEALRISKLAEEVFGELPTATAKLARDIETLTNLASEAAKEQQLLPLLTAVDSARSGVSNVRGALMTAGILSKSSFPVDKLLKVFSSVLNSSTDTEVNDVAAQILRNFAVEICNKYKDSPTALALVNGVLGHSNFLSSKVIADLRADQTLLRNNVDFDIVKAAMENGRFDEASSTIDRMLPSADKETRASLIDIKRIIADRKSSRTNNRVGWAVAIGAVFLIGIIADAFGGNSDEQSDTYEYSDSGSAYDPGYSDSYPSAEGAMTEAAPPIENPPEPFASGVGVTLDELRYCQRQKARIEAAEPLVASNPQVDRFNAAVDDYNARCGSFQYRPADMDMVLDELARDQSAIQAEARNLIGDGQ